MANTALNRTGQLLLTNKSGGAVAQGDVVIVDTAVAASFTTTTTSGYIAGTPGVVLEPNGIADNTPGMVAVQGYVPIVNLSGTGSIGDLIKTHTVAKQAVRHTAPSVSGDFGQVLGTAATPAAILWGSPKTTSAGGVDTSAIHVNVASEIHGITEKTTPANDDEFVLEDSAAAYAKKRVKKSNLVAGSTPAHAYFSQLCAMLEPDAIEVPQYDTFSYTIASNATKYLLLAWSCKLASSGRLEIRTPLGPPFVLPLRGVTLAGNAAGSSAAIIDPTLPTYADAWTTYYDRLNAIATMQTQYVPVTGTNSHFRFLPGPYGNIVTRVTSFNFAWVALEDTRFTGKGWPIHLERGDAGATDYMRFAEPLMIPVSKKIVSAVMSGGDGGVGTAVGSVLHVILPSTWSKVTDSLTYSFRDDFMGASLNTASTWTRAQSVVGNVEIDTAWQWCKIIGNGSSWGGNGAYTQSSFARSSQPYYLIDCYMPPAGNTFGYIVGWSDGAGHSYTNFAHGLLLQQDGTFKVYENGNDRGAVGTGFTKGAIYRVRIRALSGGGATYEIQGGTQYGALGGATWTNITPGTTSSATNTLYAAFAGAGEGQNYVGDVRVYT